MLTKAKKLVSNVSTFDLAGKLKSGMNTILTNSSKLKEVLHKVKKEVKKTADQVMDQVSDTMTRLKNRLSGPQKALDGPSDFSFSKPNKSLPQNSQQQNFWSEMEAGKEELAKKMPGGTGDVIDQRAKNAGLDLSPKPSPYKQLGNKTKKKLDDKVNNRTITKEEWKRLEWNKRLASRRDAGVKEFWQQEKRRIKSGEPTTRNWSQEQKEAILSNKVPTYNGKAITGHHAYSVSKYPHLANRGEIIYPATVREHFTRWHGRSYKRSLPGKPYNPSFPEEF